MLAFVLATLLPGLCCALPSVVINGTSILGRALEYANQEAFRGIPYAETPLGKLRFQPPQPKIWSKLSHTFDATEFGSACLQPFAPPGVQISEDCLTLNIQRPAGTSDASAYPVMVWLHGGGFFAGRSSSPEFNATNLVSYSIARGTPIIYVNLNYRLGPLGFPQGAQADNGRLNLGLKDQLLALRWIHDHIAAFGGDSKKVTLFGESAGAFSTSIHLFNPAIEDLISGVILQSGAPSGGRADSRDAIWQKFVTAAGCKAEGSWTCLQLIDSTTALKAIESVIEWDNPISFAPTLDGPTGLIPDHPSRLYEESRFAKIPVLSGLNLDEGTMFPPEKVASSQEIREYLHKSYPSSGSDPEALDKVLDTLMSLYPDIPALGSPYNTGNETFGLSSQFKRMAALLGDLMFVAPGRLHLKALALANVPVYSYLFTEKPGSAPPHWGVAHSANIAYVYGQPPTPVSASSQQLAPIMMDYWLSFAYERNPNDGHGHNRREWLPYTLESPIILHLNGEDLRMIPGDYRKEKIDYIISQADILGM
ncbi:lipase [Pleurotus eryngii]|uniref:Carboxylic ester hydrolase n=1 Tax=Pleurotus eryngii TaxID=5323 RepID=A0A9P5ZY14_PLEER|nr:lipase [Pleurotus eryngii]